MSRENWVPIASMARILGLTVPTFRALHDRMGRPCQRKRGTGKTSPVEIETVGWLTAWNAGPGDAAVHHARLKKAMADRAELELHKLQGGLITVDDLTAAITDFAEHVRRVGARLCGGCKQKFNGGLDEYSKELQRKPDGPGSLAPSNNGHAGPLAKAHRGGRRAGAGRRRTVVGTR